MAKNVPEILHFQRYTTRPIDLCHRITPSVEIFIPFANVISISKHNTRFHKLNISYYRISLCNGINIYINHSICTKFEYWPYTYWPSIALYNKNPDYEYLEQVLAT